MILQAFQKGFNLKIEVSFLTISNKKGFPKIVRSFSKAYCRQQYPEVIEQGVKLNKYSKAQESIG